MITLFTTSVWLWVISSTNITGYPEYVMLNVKFDEAGNITCSSQKLKLTEDSKCEDVRITVVMPLDDGRRIPKDAISIDCDGKSLQLSCKSIEVR